MYWPMALYVHLLPLCHARESFFYGQRSGLQEEEPAQPGHSGTNSVPE